MLSLAQKIWQPQDKVAKEIVSEAMVIVREKYENDPTFFSGKSVKGIVGGLFYLLGQQFDEARTQREIAKSLSITEPTVRTSSRDWAETVQNHFRNSLAE